MARYTVTISRVDRGSYTVGFSTRSAALGCAELAAFSAGDAMDVLSASKSFREFRRRKARPVRMTWQPSSRAYAITMIRHS